MRTARQQDSCSVREHIGQKLESVFPSIADAPIEMLDALSVKIGGRRWIRLKQQYLVASRLLMEAGRS